MLKLMMMAPVMMTVLVNSMVMMLMTGPSMVKAVMMNLTMVIFLASCCATPKRRYWLLMPGGYQTLRW